MLTTGIDRLYLNTKDFDISSAKLDKRTMETWYTSFDLETGEEVQTLVNKSSKFLNDKATGITVNVNEDGLLCVFNPNRILTGTHHEVRPQAEVGEAVQKVGAHLKAKNISIDFEGAGISHIDLCRQAQLTYPIEAYFPAFNTLNLNRLKRTGYEKGFYFSSSHSEGVFYDKAHQCRQEFKVKGLPETLTRFEIRFNDRRTVGANLKANNLHGLNMVNVDHVFNNYATKRIFNNSKQLSIQPASGALGKYLQQKENGLMTFVNHLLLMRGGSTSIVSGILDAFGSLDAFRHECVSVHGMDRTTFYRNWKKILSQDDMYQRVMLKKGVTSVDLVAELKEKFELVA